MKKVYEKPCIYMEEFELSSHIAACQVEFKNNEDGNSCYATGNIGGSDDDVVIFASRDLGCFVEENETSCYFVHDDNSKLLNS